MTKCIAESKNIIHIFYLIWESLMSYFSTVFGSGVRSVKIRLKVSLLSHATFTMPLNIWKQSQSYGSFCYYYCVPAKLDRWSF